MTLHERIEYHMKLNKLSKAALAKKIDKPYSTVDNWFKRNSFPSSETIESIANALNVTAEYLITGIETQNASKLSSEEQQLLYYYRTSNQEGKNRIMEQAEFLSEKHPSNLPDSNTESA
ncbi:MAG: helix-turn-helix domain-containing protein [Lachnospiraceae bacterium]